MSVVDFILELNLRFKIIHSIPGRLRIHIPKGKEVPEEWQFSIADFDIKAHIPGIKSWDFNYITGNALIQYDSRVLNDKKIIENLKQIAKLGVKHRKQLEAFGPGDKEEATHWFAQMLEQEFELQ